MPGYHWCPILPEDKQVECHCSSSVDQKYPLQFKVNPNKSEENSKIVCNQNSNDHYTSPSGLEMNNMCWCQQCIKYPNVQTDCVEVSTVNPICQVHSNIFPIIFSHSHHASTVNSPPPKANCPDIYSMSTKKEIKNIFNTQV